MKQVASDTLAAGCMHRMKLAYLTVLPEVNALILLEVVCQEVHNALVKIVTTKVSVTTGTQHLKHSISHLPIQQPHIRILLQPT